MSEGSRSPLLSRPSQWGAIAVAVVLGLLVARYADLEPRVEGDFFFASDDPQVRAEEEIEKRFGASPQVFVAVRSEEIFSRPYLHRLHALSTELAAIDGVANVRSLTHGPRKPERVLEDDPEDTRKKVEKSPFWRRLLLAPDGEASFVVLRLAGKKHERTVTAIDRVTRRFDTKGFRIGTTGVPYVSEHIRRGLSRDLKTFTVAALVAFALLMGVLFRSLAAVVGMTTASLTACFLTFLIREVAGLSTALLTPNLWIIAFVLTLSHVVYLTASYRLAARERGEEGALREAVRLTGPPSLWSLLANLLGFLSLLLAPAKPLRELGLSGGIAAVAAIVCAYGVYPLFLRSVPGPRREPGRLWRGLDRFFTARHPRLALLVTIVALALAPFSRRVDTDPALPSYFARGGEIRDGIEAVDRAGGTSPLDLVVRDSNGGGLGNDDSFERLKALQADLEEDPAVGAVLSIAVLMEETDRRWYSFLIPWKWRFELLERPKLGRVGRSFVSEDRRSGRFILRMRELGREQARGRIVARLAARAREHGFEVETVGGLFRLQGEMARLVRRGVVRGLGGLLAVFFVITLITSRSPRDALAMTLCLALVPLALFGAVALAGMPVDVIAAPAANVALPMGIDEMIHLSYALRRARRDGTTGWRVWRRALGELWAPIVASVLIVAAGFALFTLSRFPPTQRLGALVSLGGIATDAVVLLVLPAVATLFRRKDAKGSAAEAADDGSGDPPAAPPPARPPR